MSTEGSLRVDYTVTEDDVYRFLVYHSLHNYPIVGVVAVELLLLFGFTMHSVSSDFNGVPMGVGALCGLLVVGVALLLLQQVFRRKSRGSGQATVGTVGEHTVEISPDGFFATSARAEGRLKWASFVRIVGTPDYLLFYMSKRLATIIPRRAFPSPAASEAFLRAAKEWHAIEKALDAP